MKKYLAIIILFSLVNTAFTQTQPNLVPNLTLWLRADSNVILSGSTVSQWNDCSGNSNNATQSVSSSQPLLVNNILNGQPVLNFDGVNDFFDGTTITNIDNSSISIFIVTCGLTYNGIYASPLFGINCYPTQFQFLRSAISQSLNVSNTGTFASGLISANNSLPNSGFSYKLFGYTKDFNVISKIYTNGTFLNSSTNSAQIGAFTNGNYYIGLGNGVCYTDYYNGNIAEIIVYNRNLSDNERQQIEAYLDSKYAGPSVNLGNDTIAPGFCPITLDAGSRFSSFLWSTGAITQTIQVSNTDTVWVDATNIFGIHSYDTIIIDFPKITLQDTLFCNGSNVTLSTGLSGSYSYNWTGGLTTPTINVNTPGNYSVTVTDAGSCSVASPIINVSEDDFPSTASLGPDLSLCVGNAIGLVAPVPLPLGLTYNWSTLANTPTIAITVTDTYTVTVTDLNGCSASDAVIATIVGTAPNVHFTSIPGCSGIASLFNNTSNPTGTAWDWDFGDGSPHSNSSAPSHIYTNGGNYLVRLTVTEGTCSNYHDSTIHIPASPIPSFSVSTACINNPYTFTDLSTSSEGNIIYWDWDFGDGTMHSNDTNPAHTYTLANAYNVTLSITTDSGCTGAATNQITVANSAPMPEAFSLYLPIDSFVTTNHTIDFAWNIALEAANYTLQYSTDPQFSSGVTSVTGISSTTIQLNIGASGIYYWRVHANNICGSSITSDVFSFTIFSSSIISGMQLWLKADSAVQTSGANVTQWNDCSGSNNHASQPNASYQPQLTTNCINSLPAIKFDGVNDILNGVTIPGLGSSSISIFVLTRGEAQSGVIASFFEVNDYSNGFTFGRRMYTENLSLYNNGAGIDALPAPSMPNSGYPFKIATGIKSYGSNTKLYLNTILASTSANSILNGPFSNTNYKIGFSQLWNYLKGDIAEIILFDKALTQTEKNTVDNYLRNKYAPPVNLGPDIWTNNFCDTTLDASSRFIHYHWSNGDTTSKITVNSGGTYWVSVTDVFGFHSSDTVIVHKPIVSASSDTLCLGDSTTFNLVLYAPYTITWAWNGDTLHTQSYVLHAGDTVMLHVNDTSGCSVNRQIIMHMDNFPASNLLPSAPFSVCTGDIIYPLIDTSLIETYDWFDGTSHSYNGYYTITQTSGFTLTLTVTNARGCKATDIVNVSIAGTQPNVNFIFTPVCNYGGVANTSFDDQSTANTGVLTTWQWNFGDSTSLTLSSSNLFFHPYTEAAYYDVSLTVTTNQGCKKTITQQVPVYSVPVPQYQPHLGCQGSPVTLNDHSISTVGDITDWDWTFDDPSNPQVSSDTNPQHVFANTGYYDIHLVVTTEYGCTDSITDSIRIRYAPAVGFTYTNVCDGNPVYFSDTTQTQPWALIYEWYWDFGNSQTSILENPVYTFDSAGTYNVTLSVHSINGCVASDTQQVVVHAIPSAVLVLTDYCAQTPYTLHDISSVLSPDSIASWLWDFGSLGTSNDSTPTLTISSPGDYPVSLTVASNAGCEDIISDIIHVFPVPTATFLPSEYYCTAPCTITFTNSSVNALNYQWTFGDSNSTGSIIPSPSYTYLYNDSSGFPVVLYATNSYGCSDSSYVMVFVTPTTGDIMVSDVKAVKQNGFVTLSAKITNLGTRSVYSIDVYAKTAGGTAYKETMNLLTDPLKPGKDTVYTFTGQYQLSDQQVTEYICVEAQITNYVPDDDPTNNEQCLTFTTQFIAFEPYPSPVNDEVNIDFILPFEDNVVITLYGMKGDKVKDIYSGTAQKGLNKITLDVSDLALAVYTYRILFRDDQKILKFVKY